MKNNKKKQKWKFWITDFFIKTNIFIDNYMILIKKYEIYLLNINIIHKKDESNYFNNDPHKNIS